MDSTTLSTHKNHAVQLGLDYEIQSANDWQDEYPSYPVSLWCDDWQSVVRLGRHLLETHKLNADRLQEFYEEPHKYEAEWKELVNG